MLGAASIALSIFLLNTAEGQRQTAVLLSGLAGEVVSLAAILLSIAVGRDSCRKALYAIDEAYLAGDWRKAKMPFIGNLVGWLNWLALLSFIWGLGAILLFAYLHFGEQLP